MRMYDVSAKQFRIQKKSKVEEGQWIRKRMTKNRLEVDEMISTLINAMLKESGFG